MQGHGRSTWVKTMAAAVAVLVLAGCAVEPAPVREEVVVVRPGWGPGPVWVPGHFGYYGYWHPGHWR